MSRNDALISDINSAQSRKCLDGDNAHAADDIVADGTATDDAVADDGGEAARDCDISPCPGGFYCEDDDGSCIQCPSNTYSEPGAFYCTDCPRDSTSTPGSSRCSCREGYYWDGYNCIQCPTNEYDEGDTINCFPCPTATDFPDSCNCSAGSWWSSEYMVCRPCHRDHYSKANAMSCTPCPQMSSSGVGADSCECAAGHFKRTESECVACPVPSVSISGLRCVCPAGSTWASINNTCIKCPQGFYNREGDIECFKCPEVDSGHMYDSTTRDQCFIENETITFLKWISVFHFGVIIVGFLIIISLLALVLRIVRARANANVDVESMSYNAYFQ